MSKLYLQEKITPVPGQYVVVGENGFLTAGRLVSDVTPLVIVTVPTGYSESDFSAICNGQDKIITVESLSETKFKIYLPSFGFWIITAQKTNIVNGVETITSSLSGVINAENIDTYYLTLSPDISVSTLNDTQWGVIKTTADEGMASLFWSVGDRKSINLSGTMGTVPFNGLTVYAYIIGFDHNAEIEGSGITFQLGFTGNDTTSKNIAFIDTYDDTTESSSAFCMYYSASSSSSSTVYPGWEGTTMRTAILNGTSNSFYSCLPSDLTSVITPKTIYTNNFTGKMSDDTYLASNITPTTNNIFLLSEYEVLGATTNSSSYESMLQKQYDYYKSFSKVKYSLKNTNASTDISSSGCKYWTRSRSNNTASKLSYACVSSTGTAITGNAAYSHAVAPAFHIGVGIPLSTNIFISNAGSSTTTSSYASSYIKLNDSSGAYYSVRKLLVTTGTVIRFYGKSGSSSVGKVGLKINDVVTGTTTAATSTGRSKYVELGSYTVDNTGIINIKLVYTNEDNDEGTNYIEVTTS